MLGHGEPILSVAFSPDGTRIVSGSDDCTVLIWDATLDPNLLPEQQGHVGKVSSIAFSPNGSHVVSGSSDGIIHIWDAVSGAVCLPAL